CQEGLTALMEVFCAMVLFVEQIWALLQSCGVTHTHTHTHTHTLYTQAVIVLEGPWDAARLTAVIFSQTGGSQSQTHTHTHAHARRHRHRHKQTNNTHNADANQPRQ